MNINVDVSGEVELENVPLRRDALRFVDTSLDVKNGLVGRVKLKIPSSLRSEPWSIIMEKVYVVVSPQRHDDYDEMQEDVVSQEIKLSSLDGIESEWRAKHDNEYGNAYAPSYSAWMTFGTGFIGSIIENLQVQISDVHIRYEDHLSLDLQTLFTCGFSLDSLAAHSCDRNWIPSSKFVQREPGDMMTFKLVELQNMAVYINVGGESFSELDRDDLLEKMSTSNRGNLNRNNYVIGPVTANAMIRRNCSEKPLNSKKNPRISCTLDLGAIEFRISDEQYQSCVMVGRTFHQLHKNRKFWRWRPHEPVLGNAKLWWQYAITSHMEEIHERNLSHTWDRVLSKAKENVRYVAAFQSYLKNPVVVEPEDKELKAAVDASRSYNELKILRELAVARLEKEMADENIAKSKDLTPTEENSEAAAQSMLQGWFPLWWGWYSADPNDMEFNPESTSPSSHLNETSIEDELLEALADDAHNVVPYKDVVFLQANFTMDKCLVLLHRYVP